MHDKTIDPPVRYHQTAYGDTDPSSAWPGSPSDATWNCATWSDDGRNPWRIGPAPRTSCKYTEWTRKIPKDKNGYQQRKNMMRVWQWSLMWVWQWSLWNPEGMITTISWSSLAILAEGSILVIEYFGIEWILNLNPHFQTLFCSDPNFHLLSPWQAYSSGYCGLAKKSMGTSSWQSLQWWLLWPGHGVCRGSGIPLLSEELLIWFPMLSSKKWWYFATFELKFMFKTLPLLSCFTPVIRRVYCMNSV